MSDWLVKGVIAGVGEAVWRRFHTSFLHFPQLYSERDMYPLFTSPEKLFLCRLPGLGISMLPLAIDVVNAAFPNYKIARATSTVVQPVLAFFVFFIAVA
eukprot:1340629-Amorphochlora_amoeboformis.AAC.1